MISIPTYVYYYIYIFIWIVKLTWLVDVMVKVISPLILIATAKSLLMEILFIPLLEENNNPSLREIVVIFSFVGDHFNKVVYLFMFVNNAHEFKW